MITFRLLLAILLFIPAGGASAVSVSPSAARAEIIYGKLDAYSDATRAERANFKAWAERRAADFMPPGRKVVITIIRLDMAGRFEPWHGPQFTDVRVVRDVYPPRIGLQFKLVDAAGTVLSDGARDLRTPGLPVPTAYPNGDDPLRFEKTLFDDWLKREFPRAPS